MPAAHASSRDIAPVRLDPFPAGPPAIGLAGEFVEPTLDDLESASTLTERFHLVLRGETCRQIARRTGCSAETVRRYLHGQSCSVEFLTRVCIAWDLSAEWLLFGRGRPKYIADGTPGLADANLAAILREVAKRFERLESTAQPEHGRALVTERKPAVRLAGIAQK